MADVVEVSPGKPPLTTAVEALPCAFFYDMRCVNHLDDVKSELADSKLRAGHCRTVPP